MLIISIITTVMIITTLERLIDIFETKWEYASKGIYDTRAVVANWEHKIDSNR